MPYLNLFLLCLQLFNVINGLGFLGSLMNCELTLGVNI